MFIILSLTLGFLAITIHELGHYRAMRECGLTIKEVALLGIPIRFLPSWTWKRGDTKWGIHPFILGAYVETCKKNGPETKGLWDQVYIYANGVTANIIYGLILLGIAAAYQAAIDEQWVRAGGYLVAFWGMGWVLWFGRYFIAWAWPILSLPTLALFGWDIFNTTATEAVSRGNGGPLALVAMLSKADSIDSALRLAFSVSVSLGLFNLIPIAPFDGGKIFAAVIKRFTGAKGYAIFHVVTIPIALSLVCYILGLDVLRVFKH